MLFWSATSRQVLLKKSMHLLHQFWSISLCCSEANSPPNVSEITSIENKRSNCIVEISCASWESQLPLSRTGTAFLHFITVFCVHHLNVEICNLLPTTPFAFQVQPCGLTARLPSWPDTKAVVWLLYANSSAVYESVNSEVPRHRAVYTVRLIHVVPDLQHLKPPTLSRPCD